MKIKILAGVLALIVVIGLGYYVLSNPNLQSDVKDINQNLKGNIPSLSRAKLPDTLLVYETDADSADECSSYETFDPETKTCYFECSNKQECEDIQQSIADEVDGWTDDKYSNFKVDEKAPTDKDVKAAAEYSVSKGEQISLKTGKTGSEDMAIWKHISNISPDDFSDKYIETFQIFNDPNSDILAFVDNEDQNGKWRVSVNQAGYDASTVRERNFTIVHELGHIVTLNMTQIKFGDKNTCKNYFTAEGCANPNSYLNLFTKKFWTASDILKSQREEATTGNTLYRQNKFVTEYASTNPEEDMAESFAYFVLEKKNKEREVKDQKSAFYYQFPELVTIRDLMRSGVSSDVVRERRLMSSERKGN